MCYELAEAESILYFVRWILLWRTAVCLNPASSSSVLKTGPVREETPAVHVRMRYLRYHPYPPVPLLLLHHLGLRKAFIPR